MNNDVKDPFGLQPVWDAIIDVYREYAKICDRHGLRYYVVYGNAIGAVRHGGFIPWDDDFDVSMPRPDYEKFLEIANEELPERLKIVTWRNTPEFNMISAKVQLADAETVKRIEREHGRQLSSGIYIDVFPIDGAPTSDFKWFVGSVWYSILQCLLRFHNDKFTHQSRKGKIVWLAGMILSPLFFWVWTHGAICRRLEKLSRRYDFESSVLYNSSAAYPELRRVKRHLTSVWGTPKMVRFGNIEVPLPEKYEDFLTFWYGDYMKLPPESRRKPTHQYPWRCSWWLGPTK